MMILVHPFEHRISINAENVAGERHGFENSQSDLVDRAIIGTLSAKLSMIIIAVLFGWSGMRGGYKLS